MKQHGFLKRFKQSLCAALSCLILFLCPMRAYAIGTTLAITVGSFTIGQILAAVGVLAGGAAVAVLIGNWNDEATYLSLGAIMKLGSYAQRVYGNARSDNPEIAKKYQKIEQALIACMSSSWGSTITGIQPLAADLKEFLSSVYGYGTMGKLWQVPTVPDSEEWGISEWSSRDFYPLPTSPAVLVPFMANNPDYTLFLTSYVTCTWSPKIMNIQNWYYINTLDIFGIYHATTRTLTTYKRNAATSTYSEFSAYAYSAFLDADGVFMDKVSSTSYWQRPTIRCSPADAGELSFPVFTTIADAEHYVSTGEALNTYVSGTIAMEVDGFREDLAALEDSVISDVFALPSSAEAAASHVSDLVDVYPAGTIADVQETITASGLKVGASDIPGTGDLTLSDVVSGILAIPGAIVQAIEDFFTISTEDVEQFLSLPDTICSKFPFCIPFDLAHLISALFAEPQAPKFVFPLKLDYEFLHIDYEFVIDLTEWEQAATTLRILLDILFCACLIGGTRSLIGG